MSIRSSRRVPCRVPAAAVAFLLVAACFAACGERGSGEGSARKDGAPPTADGTAIAPEAPVVRTSAGFLRGVPSAEGDAGRTGGDGGAAFLGIPYAAAPVGAGRWRPPEPPAAWDGVRDATALGPSCPQPPTRADFVRRVARRLGGNPDAAPPLEPQSEDCLYLNVWTPGLPGAGVGGSAEEAPSGGGLPVLFWIHGGSGTIGSASVPLFDGRRLASRGAVVVTVNYRLGPLGFLAHPALSAERAAADEPEGVSGNYALLDLVRALEWVRAEIPGFGGDPDEVVIVGQSAGAALAAHLLAAPMAEGLFRGAILQSGTGLGLAMPLRVGDGAAAGPTGESIGRRLASAVGADTARDVAAALRAVPSDRLIEAGLASGAMPDRPVIDGWVVPAPLDEMLRAGRGGRVPVIVGTNSLEAAVLVPPSASLDRYRRSVEETYGGDAAEVLSLYPAVDSASAARALRLLTTDDWLAAPARRLADLLAGAGHPVWLYRFDHPLPSPRGEEVGAFHGVEMPFLFGNVPAAWRAPEEPARGRPPGLSSAPARTVSDHLAGAWIRFAATGDPTGTDGAVARWPVHRAGRAPEALFFRDQPSVGPLPRQSALDLFDGRLAGVRSAR